MTCKLNHASISPGVTGLKICRVDSGCSSTDSPGGHRADAAGESGAVELRYNPDPPREPGDILHPRQWFLGLQWLLMQIQWRWKGLSLQWMSTPESIVTAFDKIACLERWELAQLPVPSRYGPVTTYD